MSQVRLIVGLGNPGPQYEQTRHNAGFWFLDELSRQYHAELRKEARFHGDVGRCSIGGHDCRLQKPLTFMNRSGQAVVALANFYRIEPSEILVVHDELDLDPGTARLKRGGGHGGHNGLRDLISHLGGKDFWRLRLGIGHPGHRDQVVDFVLQRPSRDERTAIDVAMDASMAVISQVVAGDFERAMHQLHSSS